MRQWRRALGENDIVTFHILLALELTQALILGIVSSRRKTEEAFGETFGLLVGYLGEPQP